mmetsp:Transcript_64578/g.154301  ORF Transcript_64578/g.154301 Transcript_64578/m.154301 type:complete len:227 (+) Transcript_64578:593-1273(+)
MYRKVSAASLCRFSPLVLERRYRNSSIKVNLGGFKERGFDGAVALREAMKEWERRQHQKQNASDLHMYQRMHGIAQPSAEDPPPAAHLLTPTPPGPPRLRFPNRESTRPQVVTPFGRCSLPAPGAGVPAALSSGSMPVRFQGMMVPFHEQVEASGVAPARITTDDLEQARDLLGVSPGADRAALKRARRLAALTKHPDKVPQSNKAWAHDKWIAINKAYDLLLKQL